MKCWLDRKNAPYNIFYLLFFPKSSLTAVPEVWRKYLQNWESSRPKRVFRLIITRYVSAGFVGKVPTIFAMPDNFEEKYSGTIFVHNVIKYMLCRNIHGKSPKDAFLKDLGYKVGCCQLLGKSLDIYESWNIASSWKM